MKPTDALADYNVMPKGAIKLHPNTRVIHVRNYDHKTKMFTLYDKDLSIEAMADELKRVKTVCDSWLTSAKL